MENITLPHAWVAGRSASPTPDWLAFLPPEWRAMVIEPLDFKQHHEYEMAAKRCFGYEVDGSICYYAHSYLLNESRSDDDEDFYEVVAYGESVRAWRLRDDRGVSYRAVHSASDAQPSRGFFSFAEQHPR